VIDDDEDTSALVKHLLAMVDDSWSVDWAPTYEAGVLELTSARYDAALLDYRLGAHTGVELLASVRAMHGLPPIVLLTGVGDRDMDIAAMASGASGYLDKQTLSAALLERTLRHALAQRRAMSTEPLSRAKLDRSRRRIERIIATGAFHPVFQPIVDLSTRAAVGYEGLTRFGDGLAPDHVFAEAGRAGVGFQLEAATLERVIAESVALPANAWLGLNVSAALTVEHDLLARVLRDVSRPVVLEITEHDTINDYPAVCAAIALLGSDVRIAVDDAGAGVANFSHIVELHPQFVKLDMSLVRRVDRDITRQALIVGLSHFAHATEAFVIAEGIETEAELQALIDLGVVLGQGYLLGFPSALPDLAATVVRATS
jgi:EAL domain-containing protein (putative c-di-GMP-specific phosphodiesterase class I)